MNDTFNINRFGLLLKKTLMERPSQLIGLAGLSFALSFLVYGLAIMLSGYEDAQNASFVVGLVGGGCFLASFVYGHFISNASGCSWLTLPASTFEKWLTGVVITGICYLGLFLLFFRIMDASFVAVYHRNLDPASPFYKDRYDMVNIFPYNGFVAVKSGMLFLNFAGIMLVGSLYFNKATFIKVALITCGICMGLFMLNILIAHLFIKNVQTAFPYAMVWIWVGQERAQLMLPQNTLDIINIFFQYILPVTLWGLAFLRLKEKEF